MDILALLIGISYLINKWKMKFDPNFVSEPSVQSGASTTNIDGLPIDDVKRTFDYIFIPLNRKPDFMKLGVDIGQSIAFSYIPIVGSVMSLMASIASGRSTSFAEYWNTILSEELIPAWEKNQPDKVKKLMRCAYIMSINYELKYVRDALLQYMDEYKFLKRSKSILFDDPSFERSFISKFGRKIDNRLIDLAKTTNNSDVVNLTNTEYQRLFDIIEQDIDNKKFRDYTGIGIIDTSQQLTKDNKLYQLYGGGENNQRNIIRGLEFFTRFEKIVVKYTSIRYNAAWRWKPEYDRFI